MILAHSFGPTSSPGLPGIVTLPGFTEWRNCRWLPRVVTCRQPSRSIKRIASLTFGTPSLHPSAPLDLANQDYAH